MFEVTGYFGAEEASSDRVSGIATQTAALALVVYIDEEGAGVGAIECADGVDGLGHVPSIIADR